jgi:N-acetylglucosaminyldiphosphoundecaprenol N-acetyl-beta-D-mannosaminyltransferase
VTDRHERISLMGMPVDAVTEREAVDAIVDALREGDGGWVITPNLDHLRRHRDSDAVRRAFADADLVLADGMPLVWASRLQRTPLPERVAGSDLIWTLSDAGGRIGASVFLVGGNPGAAEGAADELRRRAPGLRVAGTAAPHVAEDGGGDELDAVARDLHAAQPDLVYVGLPLAKQIAAIPRLRRAAPASWFLGLGVSLSFAAGEIRRAPAWVQRTGLEWLWRLSQEPTRLWRRYLVEGVPLAAALFARSLVRRREVAR